MGEKQFDFKVAKLSLSANLDRVQRLMNRNTRCNHLLNLLILCSVL